VSFYVHTHSRFRKSANRIITVVKPFVVGRISLSFILMLFIGFVGVVFMVNFNGNATMGYQLTKLESERDKLKTVKEQQNINLSKSQSLEFIRTSQRVNSMIPVSEIEYYDGELAVAYRK
jgi:thiamine biosynthesis protein ThiC